MKFRFVPQPPSPAVIQFLESQGLSADEVLDIVINTIDGAITIGPRYVREEINE